MQHKFTTFYMLYMIGNDNKITTKYYTNDGNLKFQDKRTQKTEIEAESNKNKSYRIICSEQADADKHHESQLF